MYGPLLADWRNMAEQDGFEVIESLCLYAQPAGPTPQALYEEFRDIILEDLRAAGHVDIVLLCLHGAMVAEGYDDCEGDLLRHIRALTGPGVVIGALLDLHCHTSAEMLEIPDLLVAYQEYPHTDIHSRGGQLYALCLQAARGLIQPVTRAYDCKMIGLWKTFKEPTKSLVADMRRYEAEDGVLSVSFGHGFPWADVAEVGAKVWVITDNDPERAATLAERVGQDVIGIREAGLLKPLEVDAAIDEALATAQGLVVMGDIADNSGGGAMSDSTFILQRFLERGVTDAALGYFWDKGAVEICMNAGVGTRLKLRVGGKCGPASGDPVDLDGTVRGLLENYVQPGLSGAPSHLGTAVWFQARGLDLVLTSLREQPFFPDAFFDLGIDLTQRKICVVKSMEHFTGGFGPIASKVLYVNTPGALGCDFATLPYTRRAPDYWPRSKIAAGASFP